MVRPIERRSALETVYEPGRFGAAAVSTGITLLERRGLTLVHVEIADDDIQSLNELASALEGDLAAPLKSVYLGAWQCVWLGPHRWLLVGQDSVYRQTAASIPSRAPKAAVNDVSSSRTVLRLAGPRVRDVLASDCSIDLHPTAFPISTAVTTDIDHVTATIVCTDEDTFDLYVPRGFAVSIWEWLHTVSVEFGLEVIAP